MRVLTFRVVLLSCLLDSPACVEQSVQQELLAALNITVRCFGGDQNQLLQPTSVCLSSLLSPVPWKSPGAQGYTVSETLEAAPGEVISETSHATTYKGATAATLEGEEAASYAVEVIDPVQTRLDIEPV